MKHGDKEVHWQLALECNDYEERLLCPNCKGDGKAKGWGSYEDDPCGNCHGSGRVNNPAPAPKIPQELANDLIAVMKKHWNKAQNDAFTLTPG